eukprot:6492598-Amphidinium_carterae.1
MIGEHKVVLFMHKRYPDTIPTRTRHNPDTFSSSSVSQEALWSSVLIAESNVQEEAVMSSCAHLASTMVPISCCAQVVSHRLETRARGAPMAKAFVPDGWLALYEMARAHADELRIPKLECLEVFAGCGNVTDAALDRGLSAYKYEIKESLAEDILSNEACSLSKHN